MLKIGMVGVGCISGIYLENFANTFQNVKLVAVCDLIRERAENAQKKYNIPNIEVVELVASDIITTSLGTETSKKDETDGIWDLNH